MKYTETKTAKAVRLFKEGDLKASLSIFRNFGAIFTPTDLRTMQIAYEALSGHAAFYRSIGIDTDAAIITSRNLLTKYIQR